MSSGPNSSLKNKPRSHQITVWYKWLSSSGGGGQLMVKSSSPHSNRDKGTLDSDCSRGQCHFSSHSKPPVQNKFHISNKHRCQWTSENPWFFFLRGYNLAENSFLPSSCWAVQTVSEDVSWKIRMLISWIAHVLKACMSSILIIPLSSLALSAILHFFLPSENVQKCSLSIFHLNAFF